MEDLLEQILEELRQLRQIESAKSRLWDTKDIAYYLNLTSQNVSNNYITRPDFPAPIRLSKERGRRWLPEDVKNWALNNKSYQTKA